MARWRRMFRPMPSAWSSFVTHPAGRHYKAPDSSVELLKSLELCEGPGMANSLNAWCYADARDATVHNWELCIMAACGR